MPKDLYSLHYEYSLPLATSEPYFVCLVYLQLHGLHLRPLHVSLVSLPFCWHSHQHLASGMCVCASARPLAHSDGLTLPSVSAGGSSLATRQLV